MTVSKSDEDRCEDATNAKRKYADKYSDHMTIINAYNEWASNGHSKSYASKNFLQYRALQQAAKIIKQIEGYSKVINYPNCKKYFIDITPEKKTETNVRKALCYGM